MTTDPIRVRVSGPLAVHAVGFGEELTRRGYPPEGVARHVRLLAGLSRWLQAHGLTAEDLTAERVAEFLEARRAQGYAEVPTVGWAITLLGFLPALQVAPMVPAADTLLKAVVGEYRSWLTDERGVAAATVRGYAGEARAFLSYLDRPEGLDLSGLTAGEVTAYVVGECRRRHVGSAKVLVTALRSLLRFFSLEGYTLSPLTGAVPAASAMGEASGPGPWPLRWWRHCFPAASCRRRSAGGTWRSSPSCHGWVFGLGRWPGWSSRTSIGTTASLWSAARGLAGIASPCPPTSARRSSPTWLMVALGSSAARCSCGCTPRSRR